jgi:nucleoside 2-deoxyribosyltransferase
MPTKHELRESAARDLEGIRRADVFWLVVPKSKSEGAAVELGFAMALGKRIVISGEVGPRNIFALLAHEGDIFDEHDEALAHVAALVEAT